MAIANVDSNLARAQTTPESVQAAVARIGAHHLGLSLPEFLEPSPDCFRSSWGAVPRRHPRRWWLRFSHRRPLSLLKEDRRRERRGVIILNLGLSGRWQRVEVAWRVELLLQRRLRPVPEW